MSSPHRLIHAPSRLVRNPFSPASPSPGHRARRGLPAWIRPGRAAGAALAAAFALALASACASSGASRAKVANEGGLVALMAGGQTLTILSDAYLERSGVPGDTARERRNAFYSVARENALVKVAGDERFGDLVRALEASGFSKYAQEGEFAGSGEAAGPRSAVTLVVGDDARHAIQPFAPTADGIAALDKGELEAFANMKGAIVIVYNEIRAFQNVNADDVEFEQPELAPNLRRYVRPLQR